MAYLTYDEYTDLGGTLDEADFTLAEFKARKRVDYLTDSRVQAMASIPEAVKLCIMAIIKIEAAAGAEAQVTNPVVTSFNTDGYSESYGKAMSAEDAEKAMNKLVRTYLAGEVDDYGVPLLYRGLNAPQYFMSEEELGSRTDTLGSIESAISSLQSDVSTLQDGAESTQSDVSTLQGEVSTLQEDVEELQSSLTYPKASTSSE